MYANMYAVMYGNELLIATFVESHDAEKFINQRATAQGNDPNMYSVVPVGAELSPKPVFVIVGRKKSGEVINKKFPSYNSASSFYEDLLNDESVEYVRMEYSKIQR